MSLFASGFRRAISNSFIANQKSSFKTPYPTRCGSSYDLDGKSSVTILNKDFEHGLLINAFGNRGFKLSNKAFILGPLVLFKRSVLCWNVGTANQLQPAAFSLFTVLVPKLDLLVIGLGDALAHTHENNRIKRMMFELKINCEILPTEAACAAYNFLISEGRNVAAALIPPSEVVVRHGDSFTTHGGSDLYLKSGDYIEKE